MAGELPEEFRKELWQRDWRVRISTESSLGVGEATALDISGLDISFTVEKSLKPEPNHCELTVYNLSPEHRQQLEALNKYDPKVSRRSVSSNAPEDARSGSRGTRKVSAPKTGRIRVEIEAGYQGTGRSLIFRGDLRNAISKLGDDKSWSTEIQGDDGGRTVLSSRVSQSFPAGTTLETMVRACAAGMGVGLGNILEVRTPLRKRYSRGTLIDGGAAAELVGILRGQGITYSIQDGSLQFLRAGATLNVPAVRLDASSGLIGAPERDTTGLVQVKALMQPDLTCGGYVYVVSKSLQGGFRIETIKYNGDTAGDDWYCELELRPA